MATDYKFIRVRAETHSRLLAYVVQLADLLTRQTAVGQRRILLSVTADDAIAALLDLHAGKNGERKLDRKGLAVVEAAVDAAEREQQAQGAGDVTPPQKAKPARKPRAKKGAET